jgi:Tol biopolymer transport system component
MDSKRVLRSSAAVLASVFIPGSTTAAAALSPPSNVTAVGSSESRIEVSWRDNSSNETGFEVHRSTVGPNGPFTLRATTAAQGVQHGDAGLNPGTQYCYKVRALRVTGGQATYSALSATACAATLSVPPAAPSEAAATAVSDSTINVTWQDNSADESGFEVHRSTAGPSGPFVWVATTPADVRVHADAGLSPSTQYCYQVRSFRSAGAAIYSGFSNTACATTLASPTSELHVTAATIGVELDPDGYLVQAWEKCGPMTFCDVVSATVPANGTITMPGLDPADYDVRLSGMAVNCDPTSPNPQPVRVPSGGAAAVAFTVACAQDTKLAFASLADGNAEIHVINATGSGRTRLTFHPAHDVEPAWSPDGSRIAFRSDRDGTPEIYVMEADGSNPTRLTWEGGGNFGPAWSPDGARIAFTSQRDGNHEIYVMNADGTGLVNLTNHAAEDMHPAWSPDGTRIAFTSNRDGWDFAINVINADGSDVTRLSEEPLPGEGEPAWSPDGTRIAMSYWIDGFYNIGVIDLVGASGFMAASVWGGCPFPANHEWSPDGRKLAYTTAGGGPSNCVISAIRLGDFHEVLITDGFDPSWRR